VLLEVPDVLQAASPDSRHELRIYSGFWALLSWSSRHTRVHATHVSSGSRTFVLTHCALPWSSPQRVSSRGGGRDYGARSEDQGAYGAVVSVHSARRTVS